MDREEFEKLAKEYGYTAEEIKDFIELHEESGIRYDDFILNEKIVD